MQRSEFVRKLSVVVFYDKARILFELRKLLKSQHVCAASIVVQVILGTTLTVCVDLSSLRSVHTRDVQIFCGRPLWKTPEKNFQQNIFQKDNFRP